MNAAIDLAGVGFRYGERTALADLSLSVAAGEVFAFLGPNGSGKTTLFRLLSTLIPPQHGTVQVLGRDVRRDPMSVRQEMGVVFQAPSLDRKLTVAENMTQRGRLYGLRSARLAERAAELSRQMRIEDRSRDRVEALSGGLRRRVELACSLLHEPKLLVLDEPSTGLDPAARAELWEYLFDLRKREGTTIAWTTHHLDEADRADRIAILDDGKLVAQGSPAALTAALGGDSLTITTDDAATLVTAIAERFHVTARVIDGAVRLEQPDGHAWVPRLVEAFGDRIRAITLGKPTLEDVFIARTGRRFLSGEK